MNIIEILKSEIGDKGIKILEQNGLFASVQLAMLKFKNSDTGGNRRVGSVSTRDVEESVMAFIYDKGYSALASGDLVVDRKGSAVLYKEYCDFMTRNESQPYSSVRFLTTLSGLMFRKMRTGSGMIYEVWVKSVIPKIASRAEMLVESFLSHSKYTLTAQELFGEDVEVDQGYMANINDELVGVREEMGAEWLYGQYCDFCAEKEAEPYSVVKFSSCMIKLGFQKRRTGKGVVYDVWAGTEKYK